MLAVEIAGDEMADVATIEALPGIEVISSRRLDGGDIVVSVIVPLAAAMLPQFVDWLKSRLTSKKRVTIRHKGVEIRNLTPETAAEILKSLKDD